MRTQTYPLQPIVGLAIGFTFVALTSWSRPQEIGVALTGQVSSAEEGHMEGVVVSAKKVGATVTTSVVSDTHGQYSFPRNRLLPGQYTLDIRAVGYEMTSQGTVEIAANQTGTVNLRLIPASNLSAQL